MLRKRANRRRSRKAAKRVQLWPKINWSRFWNGVLLILVGVIVWLGTAWVIERPINSVRIDGRFERVSAMQVEAAMAPHLDSGFLAADGLLPQGLDRPAEVCRSIGPSLVHLVDLPEALLGFLVLEGVGLLLAHVLPILVLTPVTGRPAPMLTRSSGTIRRSRWDVSV